MPVNGDDIAMAQDTSREQTDFGGEVVSKLIRWQHHMMGPEGPRRHESTGQGGFADGIPMPRTRRTCRHARMC